MSSKSNISNQSQKEIPNNHQNYNNKNKWVFDFKMID